MPPNTCLTSTNDQQLNKNFLDICTKSLHRKIEKFIQRGADVNYVAYDGNTPLISSITLAGNQAAIESAKILLSRFADPNLTGNEYGFNATALIKAAWFGNYEMVQLLVTNGANADTKNHKDETALLYAARSFDSKNKLAIIKYLVKSKADINHQCCEGNTALHALFYPETIGCPFDVARLLIVDLEADANIINTQGQTALDMVMANHPHQEKTINLLKKRQEGYSLNSLINKNTNNDNVGIMM
jgi:ankyrin repeat protein